MPQAPRQGPPPDDPRPTPPKRPLQDDCCHSGCSPCVFELYEEALERYEVALAAWEARRAARPKHALKKKR